jgi:hypothetical protein
MIKGVSSTCRTIAKLARSGQVFQTRRDFCKLPILRVAIGKHEQFHTCFKWSPSIGRKAICYSASGSAGEALSVDVQVAVEVNATTVTCEIHTTTR